MAVITVSQLNNYIKRCFDSNTNFQKLWIKGEISNFKRHSTGHLYLTLKDEGSVLRAVMFRASASSLRFEAANGMKVIACGRVAVFERDGQYQLYIESMMPDGVGELYLAYEQLKAKLEKEGLFDESHKKPIPKYPTRIGVITSPTGAAVRDILNVLKRRYSFADIIIYPALVQGVGAAKTIVKGIECFNNLKNADVIIAGRGGGSIEDLWAFNEEEVAYAIYNSEIPVISAVGHETDFTIADFVADLRAPTPSAGAELSAPSQIDVRKNLVEKKSKLAILLTNLYKLKLQELLRIQKSRVFTNYKILFDDKKQYLDSLSKDLCDAYREKIEEYKKELLKYMSKLEALNPVAVLKRGFASVKSDSKSLSSVCDIKEGDLINVMFYDGEAECSVNSVKKEKTYE